METNKFISVAYQLFDTTEGEPILIEQTLEGRPFIFVSKMGATIPAFEANIAHLSTGENFDFTLTPADAYGEHYEERVIELEKSIFCIDGKFDDEHVKVDAIIPLQNEDGNRFNGVVKAIADDKVTIDLNHPLAGKTLNFKGTVVESREASADEVAGMAKLLSGETGGCGGCGGGKCGSCGEGGCGEGGCNGGGCEGGCNGGCK